MSITVTFVGALRHITGKSKISIDSSTVFSIKDLIQKIVIDIPAIKTNIIDQQADGAVRTNALILVNDREINVLDGLDTTVVNGDEVVFIPVVHGG